MKRSFLFSIIFMCAVAAFAGPVTMDKAAEKASAFLKARGLGDLSTISLAYQCKPATTGMAAPAKNAYYYVFNNEHQGFIIVSGDDCAEEVLGYSDSGSFDIDNIPENLKGLLDCYATEIEWARSNQALLPSLVKASAPAKAASSTNTVVKPLLSTYWTQFEPFNRQCFVKDEISAAAGCNAIAMAQVMYYHKWPKDSTTSIPAYGIQDSLPKTAFNWSLIKVNYSKTDVTDTESRAEVAKLVSYCGRAIKTTYKVSSSSSSITMTPPALANYFGYKSSGRLKERIYYSTEEWEEMLINELVNKRPVIYAGTKFGNYSHAYIIDGYDGNDMFHINTGWGLSGCGYYKLSALNLYWASNESTSYNGAYSINQKAIFGISPTAIDDNRGGMTLQDLYIHTNYVASEKLEEATFKVSPKYGLNGVQMRCQYMKTGPNPKYSIGLALFKDGEMVEVKEVMTWSHPNDTYGNTSHYLNGLGVGIQDGDYILRCVDREDGNHEWKPCDQSDMMYVTVKVKNGMATLKSYPVSGNAVIKVTSIKQLHDVKENSNNFRHVQAILKNTGSAQCNEVIYLYLENSYYTKEGVNIGVGESVPVDFYFSARAGSYNMKLKTYSGTSYYESTFKIDDPNLPQLLIASKKINNLVDGVVYGTDVEGELVLKNNSSKNYSYNMDIGVTIKEEKSNPVYYMKQLVEAPAGQFVTVPIKIKLAAGDIFKISVSDQNLNYMSTDFMTVSPSVVMWDGSGNSSFVEPTGTVTVPASAVAVSLQGISDLSKITIKPNNNPNTLYYLSADATVPTALSKKNVVKGENASSITMTGGYDFYVPKSFTAAKISYSFTPTLAYSNNSGWQTIMLPYAVNAVTSGGIAVDWCKESDSDKQFLLKQFIGDTASEVLFDYVDKWKAYTPYILGTPTSLINKKMVFSATNALVSSTGKVVADGENFRFAASTEEKTVANAFLLNAAGTEFVKTASGSVKAGSAYFEVLNAKVAAPKALAILGNNTATAGDANGDNIVTVSDALYVVDAILKGNTNTKGGGFDVNNDGRVTVTDVMCIINILINKD